MHFCHNFFHLIKYKLNLQQRETLQFTLLRFITAKIIARLENKFIYNIYELKNIIHRSKIFWKTKIRNKNIKLIFYRSKRIIIIITIKIFGIEDESNLQSFSIKIFFIDE